MAKIPCVTINIKETHSWPKDERKEGKFYFELRDSVGDEYMIERKAIGSMEADRDILADAIEAGLCNDFDPYISSLDLFKIYENIFY